MKVRNPDSFERETRLNTQSGGIIGILDMPCVLSQHANNKVSAYAI